MSPQVLFTGAEIDVERVQLHNGGQFGVLTPGAHQVAHVHQGSADAAVQGRIHGAIAEVQPVLFDFCQVRFNGCGRFPGFGHIIVKGFLGHEILFRQGFVPLDLVAGKGKGRLVLGQLGQTHFQFRLIGCFFDDENNVPFVDIGPFYKPPLFQKALDPGANVHGFDRFRGGDIFEVNRYGLKLHGFNGYRGRRWFVSLLFFLLASPESNSCKKSTRGKKNDGNRSSDPETNGHWQKPLCWFETWTGY
jgi:hypothetical protein